MKPKKYPVDTPVVIWWRDITSRSGWQDRDDPLTPVKVKTVGFVLSCNQEYINTARSIVLDEVNMIGEDFVIPWSNIDRIKRLG